MNHYPMLKSSRAQTKIVSGTVTACCHCDELETDCQITWWGLEILLLHTPKQAADRSASLKPERRSHFSSPAPEFGVMFPQSSGGNCVGLLHCSVTTFPQPAGISNENPLLFFHSLLSLCFWSRDSDSWAWLQMIKIIRGWSTYCCREGW